MKQEKYLVHFAAGSPLEVVAFSPFEAAVLCAAKKIADGKDYTVSMVYEIDTETKCYKTLDLIDIAH